jgi:hypothetical protein
MLSVRFASGASVSNRKMSVMAMFRQSGSVIALPECPENKIKQCGQWQATNDGHQTCDN